MGSSTADFSGWGTVHDTLCADGRTITAEAFKHMDGVKVPLVWQHQHADSENILGHALLEYRDKGVYVYGYFNETPRGSSMKQSVEHKDIESLSIYANQLVETNKVVKHGQIKEVSLVIAGANPGAIIDNVYLKHSDENGAENYTVVDTEAVIHTGLSLEHEDKVEETAGDKTVAEIFETFSDAQKEVVYYMIEEAVETTPVAEVKPEPVVEPVKHGEDDSNTNNLQHQEGDNMSRNLFDQTGTNTAGTAVLSHSDLTLAHGSIMADVTSGGGKSLKAVAEAYVIQHGIENLGLLFPDAKTLNDRPEFIKRNTEWVAGVLSDTSHTPFSRIKTLFADITADEARAKGYIKGNFKKEEFFALQKRVTTPTTVYKKQKLDRDDIVDITSFDVVSWLKLEIRIMLDEEIARAVLIGDGREVDDEDKIKDPVGATEGAGIRSILHDHELFATTININIADAGSTPGELVDGIISAHQFYKGSGGPKFYTTLPRLTKMLLERDGMGRRLYKGIAELASELMVSGIVTVEPMQEISDLIGIIVNLRDYTIGADKGGEINFFDDFDIDYNQEKYLMETRISGALTRYKCALIIKEALVTSVLATPKQPSFTEATGVIAIPTVTGVVYKNAAGATLTAGAQSALAVGASLHVVATPASGFYFSTNAEDEWTFKRPAAQG